MRRWSAGVVVAIAAGVGAPAAGSLCGGCRQAGAPVRRLQPPGRVVFPTTHSWYVFARGHLLIGHGRQTLWRSAAARWSARRIGVVVAGPRIFAFQYAHTLYMGPFDGRVRSVARREMPLGWDGRRLYTNSYPRRELMLRGPTGRLVKTLSPLPFHSDPVVTDGSVYLVLHGHLIRARGPHVRRLTSLAAVGVSANSWLQRVGELLAFQDNRRLTILRPDGSVFAWTPLPRSQDRAGVWSSAPSENPAGTAVTFTIAYDESTDPNPPVPTRGTETVYGLRERAHRAVPLYTRHVRFDVCETGRRLVRRIGRRVGRRGSAA